MTRRALAVLLCSLVVTAACGGEPTPASEAPRWTVDHASEDGVLLSVWGSGPDDVWVAGGQTDDALVLHGDGTTWERVDVGARELLWWVYGFGTDDLYAVGNNGLILYFDGATWDRVESGTTHSLYGVWGATEDDVWIVGGDPNGPDGSAVVLRGSKRSFTEAELPDGLAPRALFKAYGHGVDDVVVVGTDGTVLRFDGARWDREETPTTEPLFSMWGRSRSDVYAVGGYDGGELLHFDGQTWSRLSGDGAQQADPLCLLSGVFTDESQPVIAVGEGGYILEVDPDGTRREPELPELAPWTALHGVWGDGAGTTYAVGGSLGGYPGPMDGVIVRRE